MSWLKDRWEELNAQVKMGDNKTASTVRAARKPAAPAQTMRANTNQPGWSVRKPQPAPLTTQQRISQSYGPTGFTGLKNYAKDMLFDNNSEADRIKRYAATGLNESYDQEQARKTKEAQASNDKLGTIHQVMKSLPAGTADFLTKTPGAIGQMQGRTAKMVNEIDNPLLRTGAKLVSAPLGGLMTTKQADTNIKTGRGLNERIDNKMQQSAFGDRADDNKYVTGAGKMFGQLGGQIATGGLGTVAIGSQMAADEANKAEAAGKSNTYSTLTGFGQGGIGALSEKYGVDKFIPGKGNVAGNFVTRMGKRIFTEGAQEGQQQFTQNYIANKAYNPNQSLKEGVLESALMGGLAGGAMSPAVDIMNRPTAPKPTTSLVAPKPEPTRTRLRPEEARIWSDYQETLYKGNRMPPEVVNQTHNKARQIADSLGVDIITGSPDEIAGRMNPLLEQSMAFQKEPTTGLVRPKPLNQSGYIQLPGGKDTQLNDTELGVLNYLNNKPVQEGSATQGEGNALPTELSAGKRQSYLDKMKKMVTPLNDGGYISLGAPEPKKLPQDIKNQFASQGSFGREAIDRIEANKMSKGDLERAGVIFDPKQVKKIAQTLPEFKANPVMTYRKGDYSYTDAGYGRYPVPEKARSGVFEFKHSRGTMRLNPEALFGKEMAQKLAQTAKDGEQVDFTDTMKASGNRLFTYDQTADIPTPTVAKPVQKQVTEKQNSVDPLESLKQEAKPPANAFQDTLPSKTRPDSIRELVKRGGNPLYHDTNANGVLGILDSGEIRANQAPFSSIAGQGKRVSTTRNFDNYSRYGKSPYRFVIDETKTGQKAIPDNREEFESIFKNNVKTDSVDSLTIDVTNPELINDMNNGRLAEVIAKAKEKGIRVETFEGKILPDEYANKEIQQMTKDKFTKEFGQATQSQPPKSPLANDPLESLKQEASYRMDHRPIKGDSVLDIAKGKDGLLATQSSKQGEAWQESAQAISKLKNSKPDDLVTVYRSSPKEQLNDGDWVTFSPSYAKMMADGKIDGSKVGSFRVPAKDVRYGGEDITEFGYFKSKPTTFEQNLQQAGLKPIQKNIPTAKLPAQTQDQLAASPNQESSKQQTQKTESGSSKLSPIPQVSEKTNAFASLQPSVQRTNESSKGLVLAEREAPNGQRIQKVRTGKGQVEERTTSNEIADALGIPQDQREPSFNAVAAAKNSSSAKRLVEALNMNDDITQAAAQAQQDGKEINFFAKKDANGRSVGVERFDPQYHKIDAGFVTDRNGNVLGNHIKVDSTGVQVNVGGDVVNMDRVLGNPIDWRNKYEASSTMERNIYQNAPTKEIADKTYKFTVGHKIQSEANYKTELQQQRKALTDRTKATLAAKPRRVKSEEYKADLFDFIENTSTYTDMIGKYGQSTAKVMSDYKTSTRTMYNDH